MLFMDHADIQISLARMKVHWWYGQKMFENSTSVLVQEHGFGISRNSNLD